MNSFGDFFCKKNALVVGGSGGIGKAISLMLAKSGANVTVHGGHAGEQFDSLLREMDSLSNSKSHLQKHRQILLDFTEIDLKEFDEKNSDATSPLERIKSALKEADILCVCYGPFLKKSIAETSVREWLWTAQLNLALPGIVASYAARFMERRGFGRILFFGGTRTNQINGFKTNAAYAAAKTGIASLTKSFALEFGKSGISAAAIFPGFVQTEYVSANECAEYEAILGGKKMIRADEIANAALFLLSDANLNGTLLEMDGGWMPS